MTDSGQDFEWRSNDGLRLYARAYGSDTDRLPVICVPGLTRNSRDFEEVAPQIASQGRRVFAVDLRGRGQSERSSNPKTYAPRQYAEDMRALLSAIGAPQAIFVGTSLGGLVAMTLAVRAPALIGGAVLNDVGPRVGKAGLARIRSYAGKSTPVKTWADAAEYVKRTNSSSFPDAPNEVWERFARRTFREEDGRVVLDYDPGIARTTNPFIAWLASMMLWPAFRRLGKCGPLLLIHGETSDIIEPETIDRMQREAPHMKVSAIPGVGHAPMLDEPAAVESLTAYFQDAP